jgi:hypothetical protein
MNTSRTPEEGARGPSWPNELIIIIYIQIGKITFEAATKVGARSEMKCSEMKLAINYPRKEQP